MTKEIIDAIEKLNDVFYVDEIPLDFMGFECLATDNEQCSVSFMGVRIWSTDNDIREFVDKKNDYESYESCFVREAIYILNKLKPAKKWLEKYQKERSYQGNLDN